MNPRRSGRLVALRSSSINLILYATVVPLFAILLAYQVYASPDTPFVDTILNDSIFSILSPERLGPTISDFLGFIFSLSSRASSIKLPSASELHGSCLSFITWEGLDTLVSTVYWARDKLFTCEISYMTTIAITSLFTKFFHATYLRMLISIASLLVTLVSTFDFPTKHDNFHAERQQFKYRICVLCSVIFTVIDYTAFLLVRICILCCAVHGCWGHEGLNRCGAWLVAGCIIAGIWLVISWFFAIVRFISFGAKNALDSWQFVEAAREKEAARFGFEAEAMERAANAMKQSERFTEDEREEQVKEEALGEIIRLYEAEETQV